jgi:hypothetical protein
MFRLYGVIIPTLKFLMSKVWFRCYSPSLPSLSLRVIKCSNSRSHTNTDCPHCCNITITQRWQLFRIRSRFTSWVVHKNIRIGVWSKGIGPGGSVRLIPPQRIRCAPSLLYIYGCVFRFYMFRNTKYFFVDPKKFFLCVLKFVDCFPVLGVNFMFYVPCIFVCSLFLNKTKHTN